MATASRYAWPAGGFARVPLGPFRMPGWLAMLCAFATAVVLVGILVELVSANIAAVREAAPGYQANLERMIPTVLGTETSKT